MYVKLTSFLVVGMKKSGLSIAKLLLEKGGTVYVYDDNENKQTLENISEIISLGGKRAMDITSASIRGATLPAFLT